MVINRNKLGKCGIEVITMPPMTANVFLENFCVYIYICGYAYVLLIIVRKPRMYTFIFFGKKMLCFPGFEPGAISSRC